MPSSLLPEAGDKRVSAVSAVPVDWCRRPIPRGRGAAVLVSGCALVSTALNAIEPEDLLSIQVGGALIQPRVAVSETYNDNIYFRPSKPVPGFPTLEVADDLVSLFSPGVSVQLGKDEGNYISVDYGLNSFVYAIHPDENALDHSLSLRGRYAGRKLSLSGSDHIDQMSTIYGGGSTLGIKLDRWIMADTYQLSYQLTEKTGFYVEGQHNSTDFAKGLPLYDTSTFRGTLGFNYQWRPRLGLFGEVYSSRSSSDPNLDLFPKGPSILATGGYLGARGEFTAKLTGMLKAGYETRGYSDGSDAPGSPVVEASVTHRFNEKSSTSLSYSRSSYASVQYSKYSYVRDGVDLRIDRMLGSTGRLTASASARLEFDSYDATDVRSARSDQRMIVNASLFYQLKLWMVAALNYEFERFASDNPGVVDYDVNRITVQLSVGY